MLKPKDFKHRMTIVGPPLLLVAVGAAVYIVVLQLSQPGTQVIEAQPQTESSPTAVLETESSPSANLTSITTEVIRPSSSEVTAWQKLTEAGKEVWRLDALEAAKQMGLEYGFVASDPFTLTEASASATTKTKRVVAMHKGGAYWLTMYQPGVSGAKGVWAIEKIEVK